MEKLAYSSSDGIHTVSASVWLPREEPRAMLQIVHGMAEYVDRYAEFAEFLTEHGILVAGNDHLGHGDSVKSLNDLGYISPENPDKVLVDDIHLLAKQMNEWYPDTPHIILGHSMGSFITRVFLQEHSADIDGAILMGTCGPQPEAALALPLVEKLDSHWSRSRNWGLNFFIFSPYLRAFPFDETRSIYRWISQNPENVRQYAADPRCGFCFTNNGFHALLALINRGCQKDWGKDVRRDLPLLFVGGEDDPLHQNGKGLQRIKKEMRKSHFTNAAFLSYPNMRHEILMEENREMVFKHLLMWLNRKILNREEGYA